MSTSRTFASPTISPLLLEREYGMRNSSLTGFQPCACGIAAQPSRVVVMPRNMSSFLMISAPAPVAATAADASTAVAEAVRRSPHLAFAGKRRRRAMSLEIVTAMPSHGLTLQFLAALYNFRWVAGPRGSHARTYGGGADGSDHHDTAGRDTRPAVR